MYSMVWLKPDQLYAGVQRVRQGDQDTGMQLNSSPEEAFKRYLHIVTGPACHRTMKEGSFKLIELVAQKLYSGKKLSM